MSSRQIPKTKEKTADRWTRVARYAKNESVKQVLLLTMRIETQIGDRMQKRTIQNGYIPKVVSGTV